MRTKRKTYDYNSSNEANDDYYQEEDDEEDQEDEEQIDESDADSAYKDSQNERKGKNPDSKIRSQKGRTQGEQYEEEEESYEDEDPFSPEIEQILADKQVEIQQQQVPQCKHLNASYSNSEFSGQAKAARNANLQQQNKTVNMYLIKFMDQSYLHVKWMEEKQLEDYSYRAKQKIRRYWIQKQKKRALQEYLESQKLSIKQRNHHFSEDEEEEEDEAAIRGISIIDLPSSADILEIKEKQRTIQVVDKNGEDLTQYFDKNYIMVERILSSTMIFPVIHPRQARQIRGKWQEDCLKVVNVLINFRKNNICIGLSFAEQLDPENEDLADYFKVVKVPIDFTMIMNRLYNKYYSQPFDFWNDLGLVFKNCRQYHTNTKLSLRKQCDALRILAYNLYQDWYVEQKTRFTTGIALPQETNQTIPNAQQNIKSDKVITNQSVVGGSQIGQNQNIPNKQEKDSTYVNLQSLLQNQQNSSQQPNKQKSPSIPLPRLNSQQMTPQDIPNQNPSQVDFWNMLSNTQNDLVRDRSMQMNQMQQPFQTPNLPKFNQILHPMN